MDRSLENAIRERAYEAWLASGCIDGSAERHWLDAERALRADAAPDAVGPAAALGTTKAATGKTAGRSKRAAAKPVASKAAGATKVAHAGTSGTKPALAKPRSRSARGAVAIEAGA